MKFLLAFAWILNGNIAKKYEVKSANEEITTIDKLKAR